jgi:hypothetical protein
MLERAFCTINCGDDVNAFYRYNAYVGVVPVVYAMPMTMAGVSLK